ncbi:MAG TPA: hypothetical protein VKZ61_15880, partial [Thermomicrobiales bacterium]|nr:hypothetical protein [Thermomicrobiales bacterium]
MQLYGVAAAVMLMVGGQNTSPASGPQNDPPRVQAAPAHSNIHIDARLDEPAWADAHPTSEFLQLEPDEASPATRRSEVRILYGEQDLYVGAMLYD